MKNFVLMTAFAVTTFFAQNSLANTLTITNSKNCQFQVTLLFEDGSTSSQGIGANPSVTIDFGTHNVIGAIFYNTGGTPAFTIGMMPVHAAFNYGFVAYCPDLAFCTWSQTPSTPSAPATLNIS